MDDNNKGTIGLIIFIVAVFLIFVINSFIGTILTVVSLIISITNLKQKKAVVWLTFIGSIILLIFSVISFIISFYNVNGLISDVKIELYQNFEEQLEVEAKQYYESHSITGDATITLATLENNGMTNYFDKCNGYVVYVSKTNTYNAYIQCKSPNYETEGFNNNLLGRN